MIQKKSYTGIDLFRVIAALLIVAIHTSPLLSFSTTGDFILTRIIARIAVPFFFMTSGFFMISRYATDAGRLKVFEKRTAALYAAATLIYIPVNIYSGYFSMEHILPNLIKDIVFDGTMYHLWYLPASMLGAAIAWCLVRTQNYKKAFVITGALYIAGLFGDSYYGFTAKLPFLDSAYASIFQITDYTRNGLFFAPIFFVLGGWAADSRCKISMGKAVCGFSASMLLMLGEAIILHRFDLQRHDSMYIFLVPCMFFLFHLLLQFRGRRFVQARTASMIIYIMHPMMIIAVRLFAKLLHMQDLFIENSLVHYSAVCILSVVFAGAAAFLWGKHKTRRPARHPSHTDRAWIELNLDHLEHNVRTLQHAMPAACTLMAVVKTEAYGHGAFEIAVHLEKMGVKVFAVATIDEGIRLRKYGVQGEILILGYTDIHRAGELKKFDLMQTLVDYEYAVSLNRQGIRIKTHIKIDTGMHRLGIAYNSVSELVKIYGMQFIEPCGMYTHLCCSDSLLPDDIAFTKTQIDRFYGLVNLLKNRGISIPKLHIQSSYGLLNYPDITCDYVRCGIALYGVQSTPDDNTVMHLDLRPVLSVKSKVIHLLKVPKGEYVGYGRAFLAERDSVIAVLSIGYGDGIPRTLSCGNGSVLIGGQYAPIVGHISMDQLSVDITGIANVSVGDTATIISGGTGSPLSAPTVAAETQSISNELLSRLSTRLYKNA